jgi:hypothetical protein
MNSLLFLLALGASPYQTASRTKRDDEEEDECLQEICREFTHSGADMDSEPSQYHLPFFAEKKIKDLGKAKTKMSKNEFKKAQDDRFKRLAKPEKTDDSLLQKRIERQKKLAIERTQKFYSNPQRSYHYCKEQEIELRKHEAHAKRMAEEWSKDLDEVEKDSSALGYNSYFQGDYDQICYGGPPVDDNKSRIERLWWDEARKELQAKAKQKGYDFKTGAPLD